MTFILSHAEALHRHSAVYAGAHRVTGLALPPDRTVCVNQGGFGGLAAELMFRRFAVAPRFLRKLREMDPVILHAHFGDSGPAAMTIADALGIPLVVTFHGRDATITDHEAAQSWRGSEYLRRRARLIERVDCVIAVSDFIRKKLLKQGFGDDRIITHYNGIDTANFEPDQNEREAIVLFVGRFVEKKGCHYLLEALARLERAGKSVRAVLLGDGPLRLPLETFARQERLKVEFLGFRNLAEVKRWMNRAMIVAVPSVTAADGDSEGLPTVVLEAQAMEAAVIATSHSGIPEGVDLGKTALLVPERDPELLANAIQSLIDNKERCRKMGEAGRKFVHQKFSLTRQVTGLEDIYEQVRERSRRVQRGSKGGVGT